MLRWSNVIAGLMAGNTDIVHTISESSVCQSLIPVLLQQGEFICLATLAMDHSVEDKVQILCMKTLLRMLQDSWTSMDLLVILKIEKILRPVEFGTLLNMARSGLTLSSTYFDLYQLVLLPVYIAVMTGQIPEQLIDEVCFNERACQRIKESVHHFQEHIQQCYPEQEWCFGFEYIYAVLTGLPRHTGMTDAERRQARECILWDKFHAALWDRSSFGQDLCNGYDKIDIADQLVTFFYLCFMVSYLAS